MEALIGTLFDISILALTLISAIAASIAAIPVIVSIRNKKKYSFTGKRLDHLTKSSKKFINLILASDYKVLFIDAYIDSDDDISTPTDSIIGDYFILYVYPDGKCKKKDITIKNSERIIIYIDYSETTESGVFRGSGGLWRISGNFLVRPGCTHMGDLNLFLKSKPL